MKRLTLGIALVGAMGASFLAGCVPTLTMYMATDIPLDIINPFASSLNDDGVVVGGVATGESETAAAWVDETLSLLRVSGETYTVAFGVANSGEIVGAFAEPPDSAAARWLYGDAAVGYGGSYGFALLMAVNDDGVAVGTAHTSGLVQIDALSYTLESLTGDFSAALDVNAHGQVVGYGGVTPQSTDTTALLWDTLSTEDLGGLGGNESRATAINDRGVVVGESTLTTEDPTSHAWVWKDGVMTDLGTLSADGTSWAHDINNPGVIVGWSEAPTGGRHAVLWQWNHRSKTYVIRDLNTAIQQPGLVLNEAIDINNRGQIVAIGTRDGSSVYVLLRPLVS